MTQIIVVGIFTVSKIKQQIDIGNILKFSTIAGHWNMEHEVMSDIKTLKTDTAIKTVLGVKCRRVKSGPAPGDADFGEFKR